MNYHSYIQKLYLANQRGMKLGLSNMRVLSQLLGHPEKAIKCVHVAGTNGKGSVVTKIAAALQKEGYRVGLYTSPHISSFRERIRIDAEMISESDVEVHLEKIFSLNESATFFEYTTALAFDYFAKHKVDVAVLETGLGGRLDATNICVPDLCVITSISLDHTNILGSTREEIAREKAGILKKGVPLVIGPHVPRESIEPMAAKLDVSIHSVESTFANFEEENQSVARKSLEVLSKRLPLKEASIEAGLKAIPPCRFQILDERDLPHFQSPFPKAIIFDVGHNPDGLYRLFTRVKDTFANVPISVVCGFSKDKDISLCVKQIMKGADALFCVQAPSHRAMAAGELLERAKEIDANKSLFSFSDLQEGMQKAFSYASAKGHLLVICGTFFIMSECRRFFGFKEPSDPFELQERR